MILMGVKTKTTIHEHLKAIKQEEVAAQRRLTGTAKQCRVSPQPVSPRDPLPPSKPAQCETLSRSLELSQTVMPRETMGHADASTSEWQTLTLKFWEVIDSQLPCVCVVPATLATAACRPVD